MKLLVLLCLLPGLALGQPPKPVPEHPVSVTHQITVTDVDLQALGIVISQAGKTCSPQDENSCRLQILLDDTAKRVNQQLVDEIKSKNTKK